MINADENSPKRGHQHTRGRRTEIGKSVQNCARSLLRFQPFIWCGIEDVERGAQLRYSFTAHTHASSKLMLH